MKKILFVSVLLLQVVCVSAKSIKSSADLKKFYSEYFSLLGYPVTANFSPIDSLVAEICSPEFRKAWDEDVNKIGLYDPLTNGICGYDAMMKKTLSVRKEKDYYVVSFSYLTWPDNKTETESVKVYVDKYGKIYCTVRPDDGYKTPVDYGDN